MTFLIVSFIAGVLTVLAPCILPLLPIIIGGSLTDARARWKPFIITASLAVSVIVFTMLLKVSLLFIDVPQTIWSSISGGILIAFGLVTLFPSAWEKLSSKFASGKANKILAKGAQKKSAWGDVMIGAALGPVFTSCSPTYAVIIAAIVSGETSTSLGALYVTVYAIGLSLALLLIAFLGQKLTSRLQGVANPHGWFKRSLGVLFLVVGIVIIFGFEKTIEGRILDTGIYNGILNIEGSLIESVDEIK